VDTGHSIVVELPRVCFFWQAEDVVRLRPVVQFSSWLAEMAGFVSGPSEAKLTGE
jgi:hypothetical protein